LPLFDSADTLRAQGLDCSLRLGNRSFAVAALKTLGV
jgi:hypothetical protein